jgi:PAS domain S-box-containing protein
MTTILLVEDDRALAAHWQRALETEGFQVIHESSVEGAIDALDSNPIDLVITDIVLESEDVNLTMSGGLAVISYIALNVNPQPRIIATSGDSQSPFVDRNFERLDSMRRLRKPVTIEQLIAAVRNLLAHDFEDQSKAKTEIQSALHSRFLLDVVGASDGIWDWQVGTENVEYSAAWRRMLGFDEDDVVGFPDTLAAFTERIHPEDRDSLWDNVNRTLENKIPYVHEFRIRSKHDVYIWVQSRGNATYDHNGTAIRLVGTTHDISERKAFEHELQFARTAIDNSGDAIYMANEKAQFIYVNDVACAQLGYARSELLSMTIPDIDPNMPSLDFFQRELIPRILAEKNLLLTNTHRRKDGSTFPVEIAVTHFEVDNENVFCANARDISEKVAIENELLRGQFFLENSQDAIYWVIEDGSFVYANKAATEMLGFSNEVLLTMQVVDIDPDYPPDVWKSWWDKMRVDRYNVVETRHKRDNGGDMWAEVTVHFVEHDRKEYIVGVTRDISQRKEAARQVKESEARFRTIADEAPAIIWMTDENKSSIWVNRQCEVYSGVPRERFYQSTWKDFFHEADAPIAALETEKAYEGKERFEYEVRLRRHDGKYLWFRNQGMPRFGSDGKFLGVVGILTDIHLSREERFGELERLNSRLKQSNSELEQFAYIASHDLRSPLRGVNNIVNFLREDESENLSTESKKYLDEMQTRVKQMEMLLDDLLAYSRVGLGDETQTETIDTTSIVHEVINVLDVPNHLEIIVAPSLPKLTTDVAPLRQVFLNLIANAIQYHDKPKGRIEIDFSHDGDFVEFRISDDGPGIDKKYHEKIFGMFQRLHGNETVKGSGMGLALIRKIIRGMGGEISVQSMLGHGTTFSFTWPVSFRKAQK